MTCRTKLPVKPRDLGWKTFTELIEKHSLRRVSIFRKWKIDIYNAQLLFIDFKKILI